MFKADYGVTTMPQVLIGGKRIGGHDDLRRFLSKRIAEPKATSYRRRIERVVSFRTPAIALPVSYEHVS